MSKGSGRLIGCSDTLSSAWFDLALFCSARLSWLICASPSQHPAELCRRVCHVKSLRYLLFTTGHFNAFLTWQVCDVSSLPPAEPSCFVLKAGPAGIK